MHNSILCSDGKKRPSVTIDCKNCFKKHTTRKRKKRQSQFCSIKCLYEFKAKNNSIEVDCAWCKKKHQKKKSRLPRSKSGLYFCSRQCKNAAQRIGGIKEIMPPHYGTGKKRNQLMDDKLVDKKCKYHFCDKEVVGGKKNQKLYCSVQCKNKFNVTLSRQRLKIRAIEYRGGVCEECGYNKCIEALEFHHLDETKKDFSISKVADRKAWAKIKLELDKCQLVCSNCHREKHYQNANIYKQLILLEQNNTQ